MAGNLTPAALLATAFAAHAAAPLPDPTRPPPLAAPQPAPSAQPRPAVKLAPLRLEPEATDPLPPKPELQSVHLPTQGPATALVGGRLLRTGDKLAGPWGEATVQAIDRQGLLLHSPGRAPLRLWLLADVAAPAPKRTASAEPPPTDDTVAARSNP